MAKATPSISETAAKPVKDERDYEAENGADALLRAHEIKQDPALMARVKKHAGRKLKALTGLKSDISSISDIRDTYNKKFGPQKDCPSCGKKMVTGECADGEC